MGLANGVQPLLGYSYGAGDHQAGSGSVERFTKICCVIVTGIAATALFFVGRERSIIGMFISDGEVVYYGVKMLDRLHASPGR